MRSALAIGVIWIFALVGVAQAEPAAVSRRLYHVAGKLELAPSLSAQVLDRLTVRDALTVGVAYNFSDELAAEVRGSYGLTRHTGLAEQVARELLQRDPTQGDLTVADDLANLWELRGTLLVGARWAPIYGKVSLFSETPLHFQAYLWGGGGLGVLHRESVVYCRQVLSRAAGTCADYLQEDRVAPVASLALGIRTFTGAKGSVLLELRDFAFQDRYRVRIDRAVAEAGGTTGTFASSPGITQVVMVALGYSFAF